jgi:hypothetical protein
MDYDLNYHPEDDKEKMMGIEKSKRWRQPYGPNVVLFDVNLPCG